MLPPSARAHHDPHHGEHDRHFDEHADDGRERGARLKAKKRDHRRRVSKFDLPVCCPPRRYRRGQATPRQDEAALADQIKEGGQISAPG